MSYCKVCGEPIVKEQTLHALRIYSTCNCARIRKRLRANGCPDCRGQKIMLELRDGEYIARCDECGYEWKVNTDV